MIALVTVVRIFAPALALGASISNLAIFALRVIADALTRLVRFPRSLVRTTLLPSELVWMYTGIFVTIVEEPEYVLKCI